MMMKGRNKRTRTTRLARLPLASAIWLAMTPFAWAQDAAPETEATATSRTSTFG